MPSQSIVFDRAAGFYDETRGFPPGVAAPATALFVQAGGLTASSRVLEVGVGTGRIALPLAAHVRAIAGVDLSRPMLDRLCAKRAGEPVFAVQGDATRLPFASGVFDAAVAVHVFHLITGWQAALRDVERVLRPGGMLLTGWHDDSTRNRGQDVLWTAWKTVVDADMPPNVGVPRDRFETYLPDQGWRQAGERLVHAFPQTRTPRDFLDRLQRRVWSSCWRLDDATLNRGLEAVRAAIRQHNLDPDQPLEREKVFVVEAYLPPER